MTLSDKLRRIKRPVWKPRPEILLCPNIPQPMHGMAPRVVLGQKWWNATRKAAYASTDYRCLACGVYKFDAECKQWLEGHEVCDVDYQQGRMTYTETVPLCHYCHNYIHDGRLNAMVEKRQVTKAKYVAIIQHGDGVLADAGLKRATHKEREQAVTNLYLEGKIAAWEDWRLVVDDTEYPPKFKSPEQWKAAFK